MIAPFIRPPNSTSPQSLLASIAAPRTGSEPPDVQWVMRDYTTGRVSFAEIADVARFDPCACEAGAIHVRCTLGSRCIDFP
jgi:hypothetical protein